MNVALVADLGDGERLWLKADELSRPSFEAAACPRFLYDSQHRGEPVQRSLNYYAVPTEAMESQLAMKEWAALALSAALRQRSKGASSKGVRPGSKRKT